jgi:hypothetical protein
LQKGISDLPPKVGILPLAVVNEHPLQESLEDPRVRTDLLRQLRVNAEDRNDSKLTFGRKKLLEESKSVKGSISSPAHKMSPAHSKILHNLLEGV